MVSVFFSELVLGAVGLLQPANLLIIKNVIDSIRDIGRKVKEFNASKFEEDILALFRISYQDIEKV